MWYSPSDGPPASTEYLSLNPVEGGDMGEAEGLCFRGN